MKQSDYWVHDSIFPWSVLYPVPPIFIGSSSDEGSEEDESETDDVDDDNIDDKSGESEDDEDGDDNDEDSDESSDDDDEEEESESDSDSDIEIPTGPINLLMGGLPLRPSSARHDDQSRNT